MCSVTTSLKPLAQYLEVLTVTQLSFYTRKHQLDHHKAEIMNKMPNRNRSQPEWQSFTTIGVKQFQWSYLTKANKENNIKSLKKIYLIELESYQNCEITISYLRRIFSNHRRRHISECCCRWFGRKSSLYKDPPSLCRHRQRQSKRLPEQTNGSSFWRLQSFESKRFGKFWNPRFYNKIPSQKS